MAPLRQVSGISLPATARPRGQRPDAILPDPRPSGGDAPVSVEMAIATGLTLRSPVETETIDLLQASGRVLAHALRAEAPQPRFDYSAMDGYAVDIADFDRALPIRLRVTGRITASRMTDEVALQPRSAMRILTGAPIPYRANAVIAQEDVRREGDTIVVPRLPRPGENIRLRGEDVQAGDTLIEAGQLMEPRQMGVAAGAGFARIEVFRKLRVAIFSTGSELRQPGDTLAPGEIYNSNRYILRGLLDRPWIDLIDLGACADEPKALRALMRDAAAQADVVITTGGVSVGDEDHMADVVRRNGGTIAVTRVAIKPGKPLTLGRIGAAAYVGLPGNPGAAFTTFHAVVDSLLRTWAGLQPHPSAVHPMIADFTWTGRSGRATYLPAVRKGYNASGAPLADILPKANSGKLMLLSQAEGFVVLGPERKSVKPGDLVGWLAL